MAQETIVTIDLDNLKLKNRDMIDFERLAGMTVQTAFSGDDPPWIAVAALGWVIGRKDDPSLTWEDMLDADIDQGVLMEAVQAANPTPPVNGRAGRAKSKS